MRYFGLRWMLNLRLQAKLLVMVLPLVVLPLIVVGIIVGAVASHQAFLGVDKTSSDDLEHMARFTLDLLEAHNRQFLAYKEDKKITVQRDLSALVDSAVSLVESQYAEYKDGKVARADAKRTAAEALKKISVGRTGYVYAMTTRGDLVVHVAREGQNIFDEQDESGRYFIRDMCREALKAPRGQVLHIVYPWKNAELGDQYPREKTVAYRYFPEWDWIVAAGGYLNETYEDLAFERQCFEELKSRIKGKKVGDTGYIYALDSNGVAVIHPFREGQNLMGEVDERGRPFIREMVEKQSGWIRYPWKNETDPVPRMKIVRYEHFEPWNWIVAVGSYENEFHAEATLISRRVTETVFVLTLGVGFLAVLSVVWASRAFTDPIVRMTGVIRRVHGGHLDEKMEILGRDELGELADAYNRMTDAIRRHREMEMTLAQQGKMASLGVLSSGVAHEINNPLGVILGYAAYLEKKLDPDDPNLRYILEIKRESKRSKKIVQDLLSYARSPKPSFEPVDLNALLDQIVEFAAEHPDLDRTKIVKDFTADLAPIPADADQLRQVAINLIFNAGAAMPEGGALTVGTRKREDGRVEMAFRDTGIGMTEEVRAHIFEPFFTTRAQGTGLGLAITRQIVERHRGAIEVESEPGRGTTVRVILPSVREEF